MKITIIGTGNVGSALARGWSRAGHAITFGVRDTENFKGKELLNELKIKVEDIPTAALSADVIVIAAVPNAVHDIAALLGDMSEKTIIDTMNSVRVKPVPFDNTTAALTAITNCRNIVKCFNTTGAENLENPILDGTALDMFMAGDSKPAKAIAAKLASDLGFGNVYDFGGSSEFVLLEQFAQSWINLAIRQGIGRDFGFKIVKRKEK